MLKCLEGQALSYYKKSLTLSPKYFLQKERISNLIEILEDTSHCTQVLRDRIFQSNNAESRKPHSRQKTSTARLKGI